MGPIVVMIENYYPRAWSHVPGVFRLFLSSNDLGDIRGLSAHDLNGSLNEIPVSVTAPVTVTASEVIPSFPITTMVGTMSRSAEGFMTVSELGHGVTTSRITPSAVTKPAGLALAYVYANFSYTGPRDSFHIPDPMFPPMRLLRASGEMAEGDARPSRIDIPPSEEHWEPCFQDTVRGGQGKLHRGRDFSPLIPPTAPHSTFNSSNLDRVDLGGERVPNAEGG